jgi:hypothetical protein
MNHRANGKPGLRAAGSAVLSAAIIGGLTALLAGDHAARAQERANAVAAAPPHQGMFVAVGYGGRRISSADGINWIHDTEWAADGGDDDNCLFSVAFGKGKFVAVGGGASVGHIVVTRDGATWKEVFTGRTRVTPILFGNSRFVAGAGRDFLVSEDGENWTKGGAVVYDRGLYYRRGVFGNGVFVFCGDVDIAPGQPRGGWRAATRDGVKIEGFGTDLPNTRSVAFGAGRFVMVGEHGYRGISSDGKTWQTASDPSEDFRWVFWTGTQFVLGGNKTYLSPDGIRWTRAEKDVPCEPQCAVSGSHYLGMSWKTNLWHSTDALTWQRVSTTGTNAFTAVTYGVPTLAKK